MASPCSLAEWFVPSAGGLAVGTPPRHVSLDDDVPWAPLLPADEAALVASKLAKRKRDDDRDTEKAKFVPVPFWTPRTSAEARAWSAILPLPPGSLTRERRLDGDIAGRNCVRTKALGPRRTEESAFAKMPGNRWFDFHLADIYEADLPNAVAALDSSPEKDIDLLLETVRQATLTAEERAQCAAAKRPPRRSLRAKRKVTKSEADEGAKKEKVKKKEAKRPAGRTIKIRIYPDARQRATLCAWMSTYRWTYNQCVAAVRYHKVYPSEQALRDAFTRQSGLRRLSTEPIDKWPALAPLARKLRPLKKRKREQVALPDHDDKELTVDEELTDDDEGEVHREEKGKEKKKKMGRIKGTTNAKPGHGDPRHDPSNLFVKSVLRNQWDAHTPEPASNRTRERDRRRDRNIRRAAAFRDRRPAAPTLPTSCPATPADGPSRHVRSRKKSARNPRQTEGPTDLSWVLLTPSQTRMSAVKAFVVARDMNEAKRRETHGKHKYEMRFKSRKDPTEIASFNAYDWGRTEGRFAHILGRNVLRSDRGQKFEDVDGRMILTPARSQPLPDKMTYGFDIVRNTRTDHFYLCLPLPVDEIKEAPLPMLAASSSSSSSSAVPSATYARGPRGGVIALDPGVRTFLTGFCETGTTVDIGNKDHRRLLRLLVYRDRLQSRLDSGTNAKTIKHRQRYRMKRALARFDVRIRNLVDDVHKRTARWLCENFRYVLIPRFNVSQMVHRFKQKLGANPHVAVADNRKVSGAFAHHTAAELDQIERTAPPKAKEEWVRKIGRKTVRAMLVWSHYRFRQLLIHTAKRFDWCKVVEVREDYTTKTCGSCGTLSQSVGGSEIFKCNHCGLWSGRDRHAARNILLRFLIEHPIPAPAVAPQQRERRIRLERPLLTIDDNAGDITVAATNNTVGPTEVHR